MTAVSWSPQAQGSTNYDQYAVCLYIRLTISRSIHTQDRIEKALTLVENRQDKISELQHEEEQACRHSRRVKLSEPHHCRETIVSLQPAAARPT